MTETPPPDDPRWEQLRAEFRPEQHALLPKPYRKDSPKGPCNQPDREGRMCGGYHGLPAIHLTYVGHADVTDRLNEVDPEWTWQPQTRNVDPELLKAAIETGNEDIVRDLIANAPARYTDGGIWINLTVLGVTRPGFGDADGKTGPNAVKEIIGDAIRNAALRFGVASYLWSKSEAAAAKAVREDGADPDGDAPGRRAQRPTQTARRTQRPASPKVEPDRQQMQPSTPIHKIKEAHTAAANAAEIQDLVSLTNLWAQAQEDGLQQIDVAPVITPAWREITRLKDAQELTLGIWVYAVKAHLDRSTESVSTAAQLDPTGEQPEQAGAPA